MATTLGKFVWYELMTTDSQAAADFYGKVIGWSAKDAGLADRSYTLLSMGPAMVGGMMDICEEARAAGVTPSWSGYIGVDDVQAYVDRIKTQGGALHHGPEDIPDIGRFAVVSDPDGAGFVLFQPGRGEPDSPPASDRPGHVGWHELHAADGERAFDFYSGLFGWTKDQAMDMGEYGTYQLFAAGGTPIGGMMTKMPDTPAATWMYYFNVAAVDDTVDRIRQAGGQVVMGPHEVPGESWIIQCVDPQGAQFACVAPKR